MNVEAFVGVDPGNASGYGAVLRSDRVIRPVVWGQCDGHSGREIREAIEQIRAALVVAADQSSISRSHLIVEDQWISSHEEDLGKRYKMSQAALSVAESRGRWLQEAERAGFQIVSVAPATWRAGALGKGWATAKRSQVKRHCVQVVMAMWRIKLQLSQDHVAEALLEAMFWADETRIRAAQSPLFETNRR